MTVKAISATILLGAIPLHVYQLPDGGYKVDAIGVMNAVDKKGSALTRFITGKSALALPFNGYNFTQAQSIPVADNAQLIKPIPIPFTAYWLHEATKGKGNVKAQALVQASMAESIERRADVAFTIKRTESEYNLRFGKSFESVILGNRQDVIERRLPGDDLYYPEGIN